MHMWKHFFGLFVNAPPHDAHLRGIPKPSGLALNFLLLVCAMNQIVTGFAQGDQVIWTIAAYLSTLDMVHIQDRVFGFALTPLALVSIPKQHILTHIPEPQLRTLLILLAFDLRVLDFLKIELCHLNGHLAYWQNPVNQFDRFYMGVYLVLNRRSQPALRSLPVEKSLLAISRFAVSSGTTELLACSK